MGAKSKEQFEKMKERHASGESSVSTDSVSKYIPTPPDGGYGWVIVLASFLNHVIVDGIAFTFGVFISDFVDYFESSRGKTAFIGSLLSGCYLLSAPVAGSLVNKFGCRPVGIVGAIIATIGFILCTFSRDVNAMMFTYGIISGIGLGLLYLPNIVAVSYYFQERRALATGIAVCGAGVGCFVLAPLGGFLLDHYAWRGAMIILAGISLHGVVFSALLRPLEPSNRYRRPRAKTFVDRLHERVKRSRKSSSSESEQKADKKIIQKVQHAKLARERALTQDDSDGELDALQQSAKPAQLNAKRTEKSAVAASKTDDDGAQNVPVIVTTEHEQLLKGSPNAQKATGTGAKVATSANALLAPQVAFRVQSANNKCISEMCIAPTDNKLPDGVQKEDYARPLYRRDIFYSGSVLHIPKFQSQPNMTKLAKSLTSVPALETEPKKKKVPTATLR